jgi:hypothetical protein
MSKLTSLRRTLLVVALATLMASSSLAATPLWEQLAGRLDWISWSWLGGDLGRRHGAGAAKQGCSIDPNGNMVCPPVTAKQGCSIDPAGNTTCPPITPKAGCSIDPQGVPRCQP